MPRSDRDRGDPVMTRLDLALVVLGLAAYVGGLFLAITHIPL
jgi:hypothetical protein